MLVLFSSVLPAAVYPLFPPHETGKSRVRCPAKVYQLSLLSVSMFFFFSPPLFALGVLVSSTSVRHTDNPKRRRFWSKELVRPADVSEEWAVGRSERWPFLCPVLSECVSEALGLLVLQLPTKGLFQAQPAALNDIS